MVVVVETEVVVMVELEVVCQTVAAMKLVFFVILLSSRCDVGICSSAEWWLLKQSLFTRHF